MSINPIRKVLHKSGIDIRRYHPEVDPLAWLREANIMTVIDVGANTGQFVREIRETLPECFVYSFEPLKDCYDALVAGRVGDQKFKAYNSALGAETGETIIHRSSYAPSSSLRVMGRNHKELYPHTAGASDEKITVRRLDGIAELAPAGLDKEILVKLDVQGFEDKVIEGGRNFLKQTRAMIVEVAFIPLYEGQPLFADIYKMLTELGFAYAGAIHQKRDKSNGKVVAEDALFYRP